mgnify:CR=1 FL=1
MTVCYERGVLLDLLWLRTFLAVVRCRSFTQAAHELYLTQPAVSRHVQKLEQAVGVQLLHRSSGGVTLTDAGERFRGYAEDAVARHEEILRVLHSDVPVLSGALRIAASTAPGEFLVPTMVARFTERFMHVSPHILIGDSTTVVDEIRAGRGDVGFVGAKFPGRDIHFEVVGSDELLLAIPRDHRFAEKETIELDELEGEALLQREDGSGTLISVRRALAARGMSLPPHRVAMVLGSVDAVLSAVERGHGIGWVSSLAVEHRRAERISFVRLAGVDLRRELYLVYCTARELPEVARAFIDWVREYDAGTSVG